MKKLLMLIGVAALCVAGCDGGGGGGSGRAAEVVPCTAGMDVTVACGVAGLGTCTGDPILTVCDAAMSPMANSCMDSSSPGYLGRNDDSEGLCPAVTVMCPAGGMIAVRPSAFGTREYNCMWSTRNAGP